MRAGWLAATTLATGLAGASAAIAQAAPAPAAADRQLNEIVVTAQKREQRLVDVPISMTAVSPNTLQANRITQVTELGAVVPNLSARPSAGGAGIPSFTMRGVVSYGVVPGSDKSISLYQDGVYIGATAGSDTGLPETERVEVLKGPQGTLFGRNATAGAVSIVTRDPPSRFGAHQDITIGNYAQLISHSRIDTGSFGPFSATISYTHNARNGDIRNLGAGQTWDYTGNPRSGEGVLKSPKTLGAKEVNSVFGALKFEPSDAFKAVYKFDWTQNTGTPEGVGSLGTNPGYFTKLAATPGLDPATAGYLGLVGAYYQTLIDTNDPSLSKVYPERPKAVNNGFTTGLYQKNYGHNLTATLRLADNISVKNIASMRHTYQYANYQLDGLGGLVLTPEAAALAALIVGPKPIGSPVTIFGVSNQSSATQYSDELQFNANTKLVTLTAGLVYFHIKTYQGGPKGEPNNVTLTDPGSLGIVPGGIIPGVGRSEAYNKATSLAAYLQGEIHITPQLDLSVGGRATQDKKSGRYDTDTVSLPFTYKKTEPSYQASLNYKPTRDLLFYGKYSRSFVSGGSVAGLGFLPEVAKSWEIGAKADVLQHRLRANLALFTVKYSDLQVAASGQQANLPLVGTVVLDSGDGRAKGFEFDVTALPVRGLTLGASLGYTDFHYTRLNLPVLSVTAPDQYLPALRPKWTGDLSAQYETEPFWGDARLVVRGDANYRSKYVLNSYPLTWPDFVGNVSPAAWVVNARVGIENIDMAGHKGSVALWARNLNNDKSPLFSDAIFFSAGTSYQPARTYGVDFSVDF
jgi:iron complex outermembrane receptor protein